MNDPCPLHTISVDAAYALKHGASKRLPVTSLCAPLRASARSTRARARTCTFPFFARLCAPPTREHARSSGSSGDEDRGHASATRSAGCGDEERQQEEPPCWKAKGLRKQ